MSGWRMLMIAMVAMVGVTGLAEAQTPTPSCASQLIPCVDYLNSTTTPPSSCCNPLKETVANQLTCLCNLYSTPGFLASFNISVNQALNLSRRCGVTSGLSQCNATTAPSPSAGSLTPPATRGADNGAGRVAFTGFSFLLLFWASMLF